jgi:HlyD family secretion protein
MDSLMRSNGLESAIRSERAASIENDIKLLKDKLNKDYISGNNIICPVENGIVSELGYKAGDGISSEKKLLSLMDADSLVVKANVPEEFIKDVKLGAKADKNRKYAGKVAAISQKAQLQNGETVIPVEITIDNNDSFLLPDFNVDISIYIE